MLCAVANEIQTLVKAHLHCAGGPGGALADVEEAGAANTTLPPLTRGPTQVDDHWLALEQAHQVSGLLALSDTHLGQVTTMYDGSKLTITPNPKQRSHVSSVQLETFHV